MQIQRFWYRLKADHGIFGIIHVLKLVIEKIYLLSIFDNQNYLVKMRKSQKKNQVKEVVSAFGFFLYRI